MSSVGDSGQYILSRFRQVFLIPALLGPLLDDIPVRSENYVLTHFFDVCILHLSHSNEFR